MKVIIQTNKIRCDVGNCRNLASIPLRRKARKRRTVHQSMRRVYETTLRRNRLADRT